MTILCTEEGNEGGFDVCVEERSFNSHSLSLESRVTTVWKRKNTTAFQIQNEEGEKMKRGRKSFFEEEKEKKRRDHVREKLLDIQQVCRFKMKWW